MTSLNKTGTDFSFQPDQRVENYGIVDFETYMQDIAAKQIHDLPYDFVDFPGIKRVSRFFTGFMLAPVAVYKGRSLAARSRKILSLSEIENLSIQAKVSNVDLFLYKLSFCPSFPQYHTMDQETFKVNDLPNELIVEQNWWIFRYAEVISDTPKC